MANQSWSPEEFLRHALGRTCLDNAETISTLVFHCERAEPRDASEFLRNDSSSKDLGGATEGKSEAEDKANMLKNKLLEQDHRENLQTTIIDDQSDWYDLNGNMWMTTEEKKELHRKLEEEEEAKIIRQNRTVLLLDAAGGKVSVSTEDCVQQADTAFHFGKKENVQVVHIMPNPDIRECPVYVATENSARHNGPIKRIPESMKVRSGRIQHDDQSFDFPNIRLSTRRVVSQIGFTSETDGKENHLSLVNVNGDHLASSSMAVGPANHGSMLGMTPKISSLEDDSISGVFDICRHKNDADSPTSELIELLPSLYHQTKLNKQSEDRRIQIIMPGMILLKFCLSKDDQIHIVKTCQKLGVGNGGFYQPGYGDRRKLHLQMMCLGKNWNPELRAYEDMRYFDNAQPPSIPADFLSLVYRAIQAAHTAIRKDSEIKEEDVENVLPSLQPDVCCVNFYNESGRLGLHQDRDESRSSLQKGLPVVSFSIGDSAEFLYSIERDIDNASKIVLESGDVLIFGGASRHIFHGISCVQPHTSPKWLTQKAKLRPGRLNLTFRQI